VRRLKGLKNMRCFVGLAALGFVISVVSFFFLPLEWWLKCVFPTAAALFLWPFVVGRLRPFREATHRFRELETNYPSLIAQLDRIGATPAA
jgi:hypothetical protein